MLLGGRRQILVQVPVVLLPLQSVHAEYEGEDSKRCISSRVPVQVSWSGRRLAV